jgi:DNA-binding MarR family transcriptional regulator
MARQLDAAVAEMAENCICAHLRRATRAVTSAYDDALRPLGLRSTQMTLLVALAHFDRVPLNRLGSVLAMDRTTLTRNLGPLERDGLVEVGGDQKDARRKLLRLTPRGRKTLTEATPIWRKAQRKALSKLGESQWQTIRRQLAALEEDA